MAPSAVATQLVHFCDVTSMGSENIIKLRTTKYTTGWQTNKEILIPNS